WIRFGRLCQVNGRPSSDWLCPWAAYLNEYVICEYQSLASPTEATYGASSITNTMAKLAIARSSERHGWRIQISQTAYARSANTPWVCVKKHERPSSAPADTAERPATSTAHMIASTLHQWCVPFKALANTQMRKRNVASSAGPRSMM